MLPLGQPVSVLLAVEFVTQHRLNPQRHWVPGLPPGQVAKDAALLRMERDCPPAPHLVLGYLAAVYGLLRH